MVVGDPEPLVEGHGAIAVLIDGGELVLAAPGPELAAELHKQGYDRIRKAYPDAAAAEEAMEAERRLEATTP